MKVGDKVKVVRPIHGGSNSIIVGDVATIIKNDGTSVPYCIQIPNGKHGWATKDQVEAYTELQPDTIYLSGTPGQRNGFLQDWTQVGGKSIVAGVPGDFYKLEFFPNQPPMLIMNAPGGQLAVPVMEHWNSLLERAKQHNSNVAPFTISGHEVKVEGDIVHIGCRHVDKTSLKELAQALRKFSNPHESYTNIKISKIVLAGADLATIEDIYKLAGWVESKKK